MTPMATGTQVFAIFNIGSVDLLLTGVPAVTLTGDAEFTVSLQPSSTTIGPSDSENFEIEFAPLTSGVFTATVSIPNSDDDENPFTFALEGTGIAPEIGLSGNGVPIANGDVTPSPTDHTDFEGAAIGGGTVDRTFTVTNSGAAALTLDGTPKVALSGTHAADFTVTAQPSSPVALGGGTTTFTVQFGPSVAGLRSATVSIDNNDLDEDPYTFAISGTGLAPEIFMTGNGQNIVNGDPTPSLTDHTDFGDANVTGGTVDRTYTVSNGGTANLLFTDSPEVVITGTHAADFTVTAQPTNPLIPSGLSPITVQFNPSAIGLRSAPVSMANNDSDENPFTFAIQGTGIGVPQIDITGNSVSIPNGDVTPSPTDDTDFGSFVINVGTKTNTFTINNAGSGDLTLGVVTVSAGDFSVASQPTSPVAAIGSTTFTITFGPSALLGAQTATVSVTHDGTNTATPYTFNITALVTVTPSTGDDQVWRRRESMAGGFPGD